MGQVGAVAEKTIQLPPGDYIFEGKRTVQRQQVVYAALQEQIASGVIHAVNMKTFTNEEWQQIA